MTIRSGIDGAFASSWLTDRSRSHRPRLAVWFVALAAASLATSLLSTAARGKLWLGPQTLVLGAVGVVFAVAVMLLAWRWANSSRAAAIDRLHLTNRELTIVLLAGVALATIILRIGFAAFPNSADEYGFLFTAHTLAGLHLWLPAPADPVLFAQQYLLTRDGHWFSQYLPGWPAIMAMFELLRLPAWLAAPVIGAAMLLVLWHALRLECRAPALAAALLLACASSGFVLLNASTYFSHCASALAVLGTIVCMLQTERSPHWGWPVAAGACVGYACLCRLDSGALAGLAAFAAWLQQGTRRHTFLLGLLGLLPMLALFGAYNWALTSVPFEPPTMWAGNLRIGTEGLGGTEAPEGHLRIIVQTLWRLGELADTASLVVPVLYVAALAHRFHRCQWQFYDLIPIANFVLFLVYPDLGGFQMGPRYWFDGFIVMHLTIGSAFGAADIVWRRFATGCAILLLPISLARLPAQVDFHMRVAHERASIFRLGARLPANRAAVVLVNNFFSAWDDRANRTDPNLAKDFARNTPPLDHRVLYARGDVPGAVRRACEEFPDRTILAFHLDTAHPRGTLQPLGCDG